MQKRSFILLRCAIVTILWLSVSSLLAQPKADTSKNARPVFTPYLGPYSGGKALIADIKKLMGLNPIVKVKDAKGVEYKVIAFQVTWKKKEMSDDIRTGKSKPVFYMVGADVKSNQLPASWRQEISTGIKAGEEIGISSILYTDPKKKANYRASDILITIL